jgi:hypothetical protein
MLNSHMFPDFRLCVCIPRLAQARRQTHSLCRPETATLEAYHHTQYSLSLCFSIHSHPLGRVCHHRNESTDCFSLEGHLHSLWDVTLLAIFASDQHTMVYLQTLCLSISSSWFLSWVETIQTMPGFFVLRFSSICVQFFPSFIRTGPTLIQYDFSLVLLHLQRPDFQIKSHLQVPVSYLGETLFQPAHSTSLTSRLQASASLPHFECFLLLLMAKPSMLLHWCQPQGSWPF